MTTSAVTDWVRVATPSERRGFFNGPGTFVAWFPVGDDWRLAEEWETNARQCRWGSNSVRGRCANAPVAALNRSPGRAQNWWLYCGKHLYGRRIEDSVLLERRLVVGEPESSTENEGGSRE